MKYLIEPKGFSENINYRSPLNMQPEWTDLFQPDDSYKKIKLGARILRNVFVNHYGLVVKNGFLVKGCAPNIGDTKYDDNNFYFTHWRKASEQWLVAKYGKSIASKKLDDSSTYLVIHSPWFSYYFWITECLPRLLMVKEHLKDLTLIYPENWKNISFVNETISLFPELKIEVIPSDVHLFVKKLVMPEVKPWTPIIIPDYIKSVRDLVFQEKHSFPAESKTYISREDAKYKKVVNEKELSQTLNSKGFNSITMVGKSIFEQAEIINRSSHVIAITGASMANFVFLNSSSKVIDLTNRHYLNHDKYKFHFKKIVDYIGAEYSVLFCDSNDKTDESDIAKRDIYVDLIELDKLI